MRTLLLPLALLLAGALSAQVTYQRVIAGMHWSVIGDMVRDGNGNVYTGTSQFVTEGGERFGAQLVKYDAQGEPVWDRVLLNAAGTAITVTDLAVGASGELVAVGRMNGNAISPDSALVMKLDANGAPQWTLSLRAELPQYANSEATSVALAANGDVLVAGVLSLQYDELFLSRISASGTVLWSQRIGPAVAGNNMRLADMAVLGDGSMVLFGGTLSTAVGSWLMKLDASGTLQWCRRYDTTAPQLPPLALVPRGDAFHLFYGRGGVAPAQATFITTNATGAVTGAQQYTPGNGATMNVSGIGALSNGYAFMGLVYQPGANHSDGLMALVALDGSLQWAMGYGSGGDERLNAAVAMPGGYLLGGSGVLDSLYERGGTPDHSYLVRTDASGISGYCEAPAQLNRTTITHTDAAYAPVIGTVTGWRSTTLTTSSAYEAHPACLSTSVDAHDGVHTLLYPNPAVEVVTITGLAHGPWQHTLYDAQGRAVHAQRSTGERAELNVRALAAGVYTVHSVGHDGRWVHTVVVQR